MENEIWKVYPFNSDYSVSSLGRVKSFDRINRRGRRLKGGIKKQDLNAYGYLMTSIDGKKRRVNQLVAETFLGHKACGNKLVVNHINFNRADNRLDNLEIVTNRENTNQKHISSSSSYTGVSWYKRAGKWMSKIVVNGKQKHLGYFKCELAAAYAYQKALKQLHVRGV